MPRNEPQTDDSRESAGEEYAPPKSTIEARIARWQETGENEDVIITEIQRLMEEQESWLVTRCDTQIVRDVIADVKTVTDELRESFNPKFWLKPYLREKLKWACSNAGRRQKATRRAETIWRDKQAIRAPAPGIDPLEQQEHRDEYLRQSQDAAEDIRKCLPDLNMLLVLVAASGIAKEGELLGGDYVLMWCRNANKTPSVTNGIVDIANNPQHGCLKRLADLLGLRDCTARQKFARGKTYVANRSGNPLLRRFFAS